MHHLIPFPSAVTPSRAELVSKAREYALHSHAEASIRAYRSDYREAENWFRVHGFAEITPDAVALYLADRASTLSPGTLARRLTSITLAERAAGRTGLSPASMRQPVVAAVMRGIRRSRGVAPRPKDVILLSDLKQLIATCGDDLRGVRDRAVLLSSFAGAFRRAETVKIGVSDVEFGSLGAVIYIAASKTDQEGAGRYVGLPFGSAAATCPVMAIKRYIELAGMVSGPLFRSIDRFGHLANHAMHPESVALIVKARARLAGKNPDLFGAHSLRSGHVTEAHLRGVSDRAVMRQTAHRSAKSLDRYTRPKGVFLNNSAAGIGL